MNVHEYLEEMKNIHSNLLFFLEDQSSIDYNFQNLRDIFDEIKFRDDPHKLMSLLHLITQISNNHHRGPHFFDKIDRILQIFKDDIKKYYSNTEIFNIFKSNKRILLFLIEQKMMIVDEFIAKRITTTKKFVIAKYPQYFTPEIKPFITEKWFPKYSNLIYENEKEELVENFLENRKIGENETYICKMIQNDSIEEFITYINKNNYSLNSEIKPSIYETNSFLLKKQSKLTLLEYATFFGSIQIIQFLQMNGIELTPSLWNFAIHSNNAELIHRLEENHIEPKVTMNNSEKTEVISYKECHKESIKCHHNEFMNYIQENLFQKEEENSHDTFIQSLKYYNFIILQEELINENSFADICYYGYYFIACSFLNDNIININKIDWILKSKNLI